MTEMLIVATGLAVFIGMALFVESQRKKRHQKH